MMGDTLEADEITTTVRDYVEGMVFADEARLRSAFHPHAHIIGHFGGELEWSSLDAFVAAVVSEGPAAEGVQPEWEILARDVTNDAANIKVRDVYAGMVFTDYLSLLRTDVGWLIVNKLYHYHA